MRRILAASLAALMISSSISTAMAAEACAKPEDITAMQAAAVQQQLMVAALSCEAVPLYNAFVTGYQPELYAADRQLLKFFKRLKPKGGELDYHAFKTRMANMASQLSIHDITTFCNNAKAAYALALGPTKSTLIAFVATQPIVEASTYQTCEFRVAGGMIPGAPRMVPIPIPKPGSQTGIIPAVAGVVGGTVTGVATVVTTVVGGIFSHLPSFKNQTPAPAPASGTTH